MRVAALAAGLVLALVTPVTSTAAYIDSNGAVSAETQMNGGGCYPVSLPGPPTEQLNLLNPEWAAIDVGAHLPPESDPVALHGTVVFAKINEGGDDPGNHDSDDQNTLIDVDAADMGLVATGNVGPHGEEAGTLEWELEIGKYPLFAWAGAGDRITTVGRWIWDCGHPDPDPLGTCSTTMSQQCIVDSDCAAPGCPTCLPGETCVGTVFNYHSEIHPPQAVAVTRLGGGYSPGPRRPRPRGPRARHWVTPAGRRGRDPLAVQPPTVWGRAITGRCGGARTPRAGGGLEVPAFDSLTPLKRVRPAASQRMHCSETSSQDCSATPCPPGETCRTFGGPISGWEVFLEANGTWQKLAGLEAILAPATVPQGLHYEEAFPVTGGILRLHASGHSLDCRESVYGMSIRRDLEIFGPTDTLACLQDAESHDVGDFDVTFTDATLPARGKSASYVTQSVGGAGGGCSTTTSQLCLTDADCPGGETCVVTGGSFRLHYTI